MPVTQKLVVSAIFLLQALLVYFVLAQRFPLSGDDYSYLYQAKLFASGKLYAEDPLYDRALAFYDCWQQIASGMIKDTDSPSFRQAGRLFWPWALTSAPPG